MSTPSRIPATIVTGFLSAGKTTLIRNLIETSNGRRIALIVNEFGDLGFDGDLLADCGDEACKADEVVELTNGCICCTVADDFLPTMEMLIERDPMPDHIVIETSGLALPQPLVRAFQWPSVRNRVTVDGVVTVVDAAAVSEGRFASDEAAVDRQRQADEALDHESPIEELFEDQLRCADLVVINKADLVDGTRMTGVMRRVSEDIRPSVKSVEARHGALSGDILLGLDSAAEADMESRRSHHDDEDEPHDHDDFDSIVVETPAVASADEARARIGRVMALPGLLRVKGSVRIDGKPAPLMVQAVGPRVETWFNPAGNADRTGLIVIGETGFDAAEIAAILSGAEA